MFPRPRSIIKFPDSVRNRNPEEYKGTVFYRTFVLLAPFYNSGTRCIWINWKPMFMVTVNPTFFGFKTLVFYASPMKDWQIVYLGGQDLLRRRKNRGTPWIGSLHMFVGFCWCIYIYIYIYGINQNYGNLIWIGHIVDYSANIDQFCVVMLSYMILTCLIVEC